MMLTIQYSGTAVTTGGTGSETVYPPNTKAGQQPAGTGIGNKKGELSLSFVELMQNTPNPFAGGTAIRFRVDTPTGIQLDIYNALGQKVVHLAKSIVNGSNKVFLGW